MLDSKLIVVGVPFAAGVLINVFGKPHTQERHAIRSRKELLTILRFNISREIADAIPVKRARVSDDTYISGVKAALQEYLTSTKKGIRDYQRCDSLFEAFIGALRLFKYGGLPCSLFSSFCFGFFFYFPEDWFFRRGAGFVAGFILLCFTAFCCFRMWRSKDRFDDLCTEYEVTGDSPKDEDS